MNAQQLVVLIFVLVLIGAGVWTFLGSDDSKGGSGTTRGAAVEQRLRAEDRDPATWNTSALPKVEPRREFKTESGVLVQVLQEGKGDAVQVGHAMDLRMQGYLLDGTVFDDGIMKHVIFGDRQDAGTQHLLASERQQLAREGLRPGARAASAATDAPAAPAARGSGAPRARTARELNRHPTRRDATTWVRSCGSSRPPTRRRVPRTRRTHR